MTRALAVQCTAIIVAAVLASPAPAQIYPTQPIRIVVGFQAGGGVDMSARTIGKYLSESLGQSVVVDNKPGASGNIGASFVAKSAPDGYTLLMSNSTIATPGLFVNLPFDVMRDLVPITLVAIGPSVLAVHPSLPVRSVKELVTLAKARPKQLAYGSGGVGNVTHLEMELLNAVVGMQLVHVPYKGSAPSVIALISGEVQLLFTSVPAALSQIKAGRMRPLAVSTLRRSAALPQVPTIDESGVPGYDAASWYGLFAPAGTPNNVVTRVSSDTVKVMSAADIKEKFASDGFEPAGTTPQDFSKFLSAELVKWANAIRTAGIKPE
ncbi:MAG TPA: tripartite tricarboxylate transporter substrate binding protein [Burkholderiales bacterium]|nr:tripartite tricarboxylate transporter substrate binding protein [Burkholderiales bacterium]